MSTHLPTDPHDFALWLFDNLEDVSCVGSTTLWEGKLRAGIDFMLVESHLENLTGALAGTCREDNRVIGFYPSSVHVYQDIRQLLSHAGNRTRVPARFTLRDIDFSYPPADDSTVLPELVTQYVDAVRLFSVLNNLADVRNGGLLFVSSHDAQLTVLPEFGPQDLRPLTSFSRFAAEFANEESHSDQKRSVIRTVLIEQFRPQRSVTLADVLAKFEDIAMDARHSLAMYMAEFSVAKVKAEVERQNLDDTLSLNKTLADIQNQLLALPAAILLAGATIKTGEEFRNYAVLIGVVVFTIFVLTLVSNQRHSIDAIDAQIMRRKTKVENMPTDSSASVLPLFTPLKDRVTKQKRTLAFIKYVIWTVVILTGLAVIDVNHNGVVIDMLDRAWKCLAGWTSQTNGKST
ncbi:hypothetical protein [Stenotrophomonas acidaminiphila]|uniref:hypothetical protein n=1 Tax=Stenotrophomonas acidaminiphila TaxID=128780 RepID=UPI0024ADDEBC|nr:hypothetical protein [Stenotrophomonas acidaminiphila]WHL19019.1 hypothetical protein QLF99_00785 [Stenotrophomonas acidaminiphila]